MFTTAAVAWYKLTMVRTLITTFRTSLAALLLLGSLLALSSCDTLTGLFGEEEEPGSATAPPAETTVTDASGNVYEVGYDQVSSNDQDPFVLKRDASGNQLWRIRHDQTPVDARALYVALDGDGRPYVVFTADGGSNDADRYQTNHVESGAFGAAPFAGYGSGGGAKVSIIARLDSETGRIEAGTYLRARLSNGNTNTLVGTGLRVSGSTVEVSVDSAAWPPAAGATSSNWQRFDETRFNDSSRPPLLYSFPLDFSEITSAEVLPER